MVDIDRHLEIAHAGGPSSMAQSTQLWCAKNDLYIQLWPLGTIEVEKFIKGVVKKLRPENALGAPKKRVCMP